MRRSRLALLATAALLLQPGIVAGHRWTRPARSPTTSSCSTKGCRPVRRMQRSPPLTARRDGERRRRTGHRSLVESELPARRRPAAHVAGVAQERGRSDSRPRARSTGSPSTVPAVPWARVRPHRPSRGRPSRPEPRAGAEPLAGLQWDMAMIHATADRLVQEQPGDARRSRRHHRHRRRRRPIPTSRRTSTRRCRRNFTTDIPAIDGPCEHARRCIDPANVDDDGHGTHVAGHDRRRRSTASASPASPRR